MRELESADLRCQRACAVSSREDGLTGHCGPVPVTLLPDTRHSHLGACSGSGCALCLLFIDWKKGPDGTAYLIGAWGLGFRVGEGPALPLAFAAPGTSLRRETMWPRPGHRGLAHW